MAKSIQYGWLVIFALLISVSPLAGQTAATGALVGTVTDSTGAVVPNVTVTATDAGTGQARTTTTGSDGSYKFGLLPPGTYHVKFEATGLRTVEVPSVDDHRDGDSGIEFAPWRWVLKLKRLPWRLTWKRFRPPMPRLVLLWRLAP